MFLDRGSGGQRAYGQDVNHLKSITLYVGDAVISIQGMDYEVFRSRSVHFVQNIQALVSAHVAKHGNSTVRGKYSVPKKVRNILPL